MTRTAVLWCVVAFGCSEAIPGGALRNGGTGVATPGGGGADDGGRLDDGGGSSGGADGGTETRRLELTPSATQVRAGSTTSIDLQVEMVDDDQRTDVTDEAAFRVQPVGAGDVVAASFTPGDQAGPVDVVASYDGLTAVATLEVLPAQEVVVVPVAGEPELPEDVVARFDAPPSLAGEAAPAVVYPNDGTLLPRNLGQLEVHFKPRGNDLFRVAFVHPNYELYVYTRCQSLEDGCVFPLAEDLYRDIADATAGRDPIIIEVRGATEDGQEVGASDEIAVSFSAEAVQGALYYWTTSRRAIMRVDFGAGNEPEQFFPTGNDSTCYGCHALSPNGEKLTLSRSGQGDGRMFLLDVADRNVRLDGVAENQREQFQSWSPDSMRFAGIWADSAPPDTRIRIRSGDTGEVLESIELGHEPSHPDWSPAGNRIAYTRVTRHQTSQRPGRGGISMVEELPGGGWSAPVTLIEPEDGWNYYNPAQSLDGSFVLYNRSLCDEGSIYGSECDADADRSAQIWGMRPDGTGRVRLWAADGPGIEDEGESELTNTFPRWAPFEGPRFDDGTGRVMWMTFSSRREYGLRSPPGSGTLLWMAAVDPDRMVQGEDGSYPAFALPFQDLDTSNHIGQWTQRFVPTDPDPGGGGPDGGTDAGPGDPGGGDGGFCREAGESCGTNAPCCEGLACIGGLGSAVCQIDF
jgi:hypothetical protein